MEAIKELCKTILNTKVFIIELENESIQDFILEPILHIVNYKLEIGQLKERYFKIDENNTLKLPSIFCKYRISNEQEKKIIYLSPGYSETSYFMYGNIRVEENAVAAYLVAVVETSNVLKPKIIDFDVKEETSKMQSSISKLVYKI